MTDGGSEIYREANSRYVAVKFSVRGRDLGSTVEEAMKKVNADVKLPRAIPLIGRANMRAQKRSQRRLLFVLPADDPVHLHHPVYDVQFGEVGAADPDQRGDGAARRTFGLACLRAPTLVSRLVSAFLRSLVCRCKSASSWWNISINFGLEDMTSMRPRSEGAVLRLRPITMTMLVATLGLLPARSHMASDPIRSDLLQS